MLFTATERQTGIGKETAKEYAFTEILPKQVFTFLYSCAKMYSVKIWV